MTELKEIDFKKFLQNLELRTKWELTKDEVASIKAFMKTIKGSNKTGAKNGIKRLQYFLNAYIQESTIVAMNSGKIDYFEEGHLSLIQNGHGENAPDLKFSYKNKMIPVECKMFYSNETYQNFLDAGKINFHNASYCFIYFIKDKASVWTKANEGFRMLHSVEELVNGDFFILLPEKLSLINFNAENVTDEQIEGPISYSFS